jgi:hypothetical protein
MLDEVIMSSPDGRLGLAAAKGESELQEHVGESKGAANRRLSKSRWWWWW